jgi:hypothetical protein
MSTPREQLKHGVLIDALAGPVDLNGVDWHVRQANLSAPPAEVQTETLELIRQLVNDGLVRLGHEVVGRRLPGNLGASGHQFIAWHHPLEHSIDHISHYYIRHYDDPEHWMYAAYLQLTPQGEQIAQSLERKGVDSYRQFG